MDFLKTAGKLFSGNGSQGKMMEVFRDEAEDMGTLVNDRRFYKAQDFLEGEIGNWVRLRNF